MIPTCSYAPRALPFSVREGLTCFHPLFGISAHPLCSAVVLFLSDMHFGGSEAPERDREAEGDLVRCLRTHRDNITHVYLGGDVFDAFIEYPSLVPKGFIRFQAEIASLTDAGIPVTYLLGNHDPWHRDYFASELGVNVVPDHCIHTHTFSDASGEDVSVRVFCAHGDAQAGSAGGLTTRLRGLLRHPACVWLYRSLFPGDTGFRFAQRISHRMHDRSVNPALVRALDDHAASRLASSEIDLVVMGHTHFACLKTHAGGAYLNTGTWKGERTFGRLARSGIHLAQWNGSRAEVIESTDLPIPTRRTTTSPRHP